MNIFVLIKQEIFTAQFDKAVGSKALPACIVSGLSLYDRYALEQAARIKEAKAKADHSEVNVIALAVCRFREDKQTARDALVDALSMAADEAFLVCGAYEEAGSEAASDGGVFEPADAQWDGKLFAQAVKKICGRSGAEQGGWFVLDGEQEYDGSVSVAGPTAAESLGIPSVTGAAEIAGQEGQGSLLVRREAGGFTESIETPFPAVITIGKSIYEPRLATFPRIRRANRMEISYLNISNPDADRAGLMGRTGPKTRVEAFFRSARAGERILIREETEEDSARRFMELLRERIIAEQLF